MFTIYSQPGCGPCIGVIASLQRDGLEHRVVNIREDAAGMERMKELGGQGTPLVVHEPTGQVWRVGMDPTWFKEAAAATAQVPTPAV